MWGRAETSTRMGAESVEVPLLRFASIGKSSLVVECSLNQTELGNSLAVARFADFSYVQVAF